MRANFAGAAVSLDGTQVGTTGGSPVVITDVAPGKPRGLRREERLHDDQAGVHAGRRAEPAADPDPVARSRSRCRDREGGQAPSEAGGGEPPSRRRPDRSARDRILGGAWSGTAVVGGVGAEVRPGRAGRQLTARPVPPLHLPGRDTGMCDIHGKPRRPSPPTSERSHSLTERETRTRPLQWVFVGVGRGLRRRRRRPALQGLSGGGRGNPECVKSRAAASSRPRRVIAGESLRSSILNTGISVSECSLASRTFRFWRRRV